MMDASVVLASYEASPLLIDSSIGVMGFGLLLLRTETGAPTIPTPPSEAGTLSNIVA
jgi:hypothetical protein